ncbi:alpha/beta hydrolase [Hymenobacter busanensis]|uniref:Alpha/beta hydrolase n=1 Tax=Hymenobacter busanensis TaxID=2607656 RepID=A0A7L5A272_9BACT|nr:alpha/beta hydrolase [Hymenobacter busanensis]KAA9338178.1 alpha/beta hydrolase [Hymenobacter busanensis]QHJ09397.1 alpha/beta fold hydrolase [Hymenobacter busanensis]
MLRRTVTVPAEGIGYLFQTGRSYRHFLLPALNGAIGDQLAARHDRRAIAMSFRHGGRDVAVADLPLAGQPPQRTVVFVHGLMGDEYIWQQGPPDVPRYGPQLARDADVRCLYVRYNTGRHISENGRDLSRLLTELVTTWPETVADLVLVGHSMGGLVIRSAGYYAALPPEAAAEPNTDNAQSAANKATTVSWAARLRSVFLLGVPNEGSFLEQHSFLTALLLRKLNLRPTRFVADTIDRRSNGIRDLRHARLVDEDWLSPHADDLLPPRTPVPPLPGVAYHVLAGSLLKNAESILARYFGDGLVGGSSATGDIFGPRAAFQGQVHVRMFPRQHHGTLLANTEVYQYLREHL